jgi:hypothetical protein
VSQVIGEEVLEEDVVVVHAGVLDDGVELVDVIAFGHFEKVSSVANISIKVVVLIGKLL